VFPLRGLLLGGILATAALVAQTSPAAVRIHVTVTGTPKSDPPGLSAKDFRIWEDGVEQEITHFAPEIQPLSLGIILDAGTGFRDVPRVFLQNARNSEYFLMTGDTVILPFGLDIIRLPKVFRSEQTTVEAVYVGLDVLKESASSRKALLVIAEDVAEPPMMEYYRQHAIRQDVPVYLLVMSDGIGGAPLGVSALEEITKLTGGATYYGLSGATVLAEKFCREIAEGLRNQYTLGYVPKDAKKDGKWRSLRAELRRTDSAAKLKVKIRSGYYATR
jgi:Ca-activated chloride channel homolog